ncbi:CapA family protein [Demetria terragena]|uniref:CapA family protein n=1 Tax=Demetria terragena TaxID=63959 RepID=UPI000A031568|nr:CapA family protein [Demetria terragena]
MNGWGKFSGVMCALALLLAGCGVLGQDGRQEANRSASESGRASPITSRATTVTVASSGDILIHVPVRTSAQSWAEATGARSEFDFDPMFAGVKKELSEPDVMICHQETPISATNDDLSPPGSMIYSAPSQIATAIKKAGIDGCSTASNHVLDRAAEGITTTRNQLAKAGLKVAGPTSDRDKDGMPAIYEASGVKVANLSYTYTLPNQSAPNTTVPPGQEHLEKYLWPKLGAKGILADAKRAKKSGSDLVTVNIHWGGEYQVDPSTEQRELAKKLTASPYVDGIFGAHAHVIQPCSTINGKTVFYGLGNFLSNQGPGTVGTLDEYNADGAIAQYTFTRSASGNWSQKASYQPTMVDVKDRHQITASTPQNNPESFSRTRSRMNKLGDCKATAAG